MLPSQRAQRTLPIPLLKGLLHNAHCYIAKKHQRLGRRRAAPQPFKHQPLYPGKIYITPWNLATWIQAALSPKTNPLNPVCNTTNPPNSTTVHYVSPPTKLEYSLSQENNCLHHTNFDLHCPPSTPPIYATHNFDRRTTKKKALRNFYIDVDFLAKILMEICFLFLTQLWCFFLLSIFPLVLLVYF